MVLDAVVQGWTNVEGVHSALPVVVVQWPMGRIPLASCLVGQEGCVGEIKLWVRLLG